MFLMNKEEVLTELKRINDYLGDCLWMDFELNVANSFKIAIIGKISQSYNQSDIEIYFEHPHFITSPFSWTTDAAKPFISLCTGDKEADINMKYRVELGNYLFEINAEDYDTPPIVIIAKKVTCEILNEIPFPNTQ